MGKTEKFCSFRKFVQLIPPEWQSLLQSEIISDYFRELHTFLDKEYSAGNVYPSHEKIFRALELTLPGSVRVVIIGQDPYHGPGEADGLAFSSAGNPKLPPSLKNIFKEIGADLGNEINRNGDLSSWAGQGVLLLNTFLTVRIDTPGSHKNSGWERFTDSVIKAISGSETGVVFMLWGNHAKGKSRLIDKTKHLVLEAPHPSPFSAHTGFFGCRHFSKANQYLISLNRHIIDWRTE